MNEYSITLFEACEFLSKHQKTISRYIRQGRLNPIKVKSLRGTLEYRFSRADLEALKLELDQEAQDQTRQDRADQTEQTGQTRHDIMPDKEPISPDLHPSEPFTKPNSVILDQTGQTRQDRTEQTRQDRTPHNEDIIAILKDTTELFKEQLSIKDAQISTLNEQVHKLIERDRETNILLKGLQDKLMLSDQTRQDKIKKVRLTALLATLLITLGVFFYLNLLPTIKTLWTK